MSDPPVILAIDLGTSGPKVALVTPNGRVLDSERTRVPLALSAGGGAEQDPALWWSAIATATRALLHRSELDRRAIAAVSATAQWAGTVAVDEQGRPLRPAILWMDSRGAAEVQRLAGGLLRVEGYGVGKLAQWIRKTGGAPSLAGKEPVAHIAWLRRHEPDTYARTHCFLEPKDYLGLKMTGEFAASYDSIALHWSTDNRNIDAIDYDPELLALTGLPLSKLPSLRRATDVLGPLLPTAAEDLGLPPGIPVMTGTPDVQSAALGSGAVHDYEGHIYVGTSSWLTCHVPFKKTDLFHNMASLPSALPGRYFVANAQETAGACIEWLRDALVFPRDPLGDLDAPSDFFARLEEAARSVPAGSDGVLFTPWLFGERCPVADSSLRGAFLGLSLATTRAHMIRAVLEGVAYNTRWLLEHVERFVGRRLDPLRFIGGGAASSLWCQVLADVLDRTITSVRDPQACNARGAALVAAIGLGLATLDDIAATVELDATHPPNRAHREIYDRLFSEYRAAHRALSPLYRRLAQSPT